MLSAIFSKVPNWLTLFRVFAVPFVLVFYFLPDDTLSPMGKNIGATTVFLIASITDWLDGYVARRYQMYSRFGEFLDPVADKLLVSSVLIILVYLHRVHPLLALIIIGREITISALREWMANFKHNIKVSNLGKWKTTMQITGISFLLYYGQLFFIPAKYIIIAGDILIYIAAIITVVSMIDYLWQAALVLRAQKAEKDNVT